MGFSYLGIIQIENIRSNMPDWIQEGRLLLQTFWIVKEKMRRNFDIFIIIACRIKSVLKTMLKFVLTKVA